MAQLRAGIQLHLSVLRGVALPELIEMGKAAASAGVGQVWVTDNLNNRGAFPVLAALASQVPVDLGTAVMVQYFHNPVELAGSAAAIAEIMAGRELSLGIARGNASTGSLVVTPKPISFLREMAQSVRCLLNGGQVTFEAYPTLQSYFHFAPQTPFQLSFAHPDKVRLYCGGNSPLSLAVGGEFMDGLVFGGTFQSVALTGRLPDLLRIFDDAALRAGRTEKLPRVAEIKLSVAKDGKAAREFAALSAATRMLSLRERGFSDVEVAKTGVAPADLDRFEAARREGAPREKLRSLATDAMVDAVYVAGDPAFCRDRMQEVARLAASNGFEQLMFSEFGPNPREAMRLLCTEVLPAL